MADEITRRLPDQHGFGLFTFPLRHGGRVRYIGNGARSSFLTMLCEWIEFQLTNASEWGGHPGEDHDPLQQVVNWLEELAVDVEEQGRPFIRRMAAIVRGRMRPDVWTFSPPTDEGLYLLKPPGALMEFVMLAREADGKLLIHWHDYDQWNRTDDFVEELSPDHQWQGPFEEPRAPLPATSPVNDASNVVSASFAPAPAAQAIFEKFRQHHGSAIELSQAMLTRGVPPEGGKVDLVTMSALIEEAFLAGVVAQSRNPLPFII